GFLLRDVPITEAPLAVQDMTALDFHLQLDGLLLFLKLIGQFDVPHVWGDIYLPGSKVHSFVDDTLSTLTPAAVGAVGFILLFPVRNHAPNAPAFRLPNEDLVFLFDVLTSGVFDDSYLAAQMARTRAMYERARDIGGTLYPIGSTPMSHADWVAHY